MKDGSSRERARVSPDYKQDKIVTKKVQNYFFKLDDILGRGSFSSVYRGVHQFTKETVAIKVVEMSRMHSNLLRDLLHSEIEILKRLWHPNILKCYQVFFSTNHCYIVTQYCNEGDLATIVRQRGPYNEKSAIPVVSGIFQGLKYLQKEGVIHRDIKLANVFMKNGVPKIADFGFAKKSRQRFKDANIGSPLFMSPQGILHGYYGPKTDVWAFGILLYQLFHGNHVFDYCRSQQDLKQAVSKPLKVEKINPQLGGHIKELILRCLDIRQIVRPSFQQINDMAYIRYIHQGQKQMNLVISQVEEFTQKSLESTQALSSKLDKESKRALKTFDLSELQIYAKKTNKFSSFDLKVNSPKNGSQIHLQKVKRISDNIHIPSQRNKQRYFQDTSDLKKLRGMSVIKDKSKNSSNIREMLPNYKSTGSIKNIYQSPRSRCLNQKIIRCPLKFQCFVALLHYCRLLFKTTKLLTKLQISQVDIMIIWLFSIVEQLEEKLNGQVNMTSQEQLIKLKEIVRDYNIKYRKELFSRRKMSCNLQQNQTFILGCLKIIDGMKKSEDESQNNILISTLNHLIFLYDTNEFLRKSIQTKDYDKFTEGNNIEQFLSNQEKAKFKIRDPRGTITSKFQ